MDRSLFPQFVLRSLDKAIENYNFLVEFNDSLGFEHWNPQGFPIS